MAEVSNLHRHAPPPNSTRQPDPSLIEEPFTQSFEFSPSHNHPFFFDDYTTSFDFDSTVNQDFEYDEQDPDFFFGNGDENDDEQMNFVTDLFEPTNWVQEPVWEMGSGLIDEDDSNVEFGFGPGLGLERTGTDSESEFEFEVNSRIIDDENVDVTVSNDDVFEIGNANDFEWEEVSERFHFDEREALNSVINRIEELSVVESDVVSSRGEEEEDGMLGDDEGEEAEGGLEWEVLLEMNNLERNFEVGPGEGEEDESDVDIELQDENGELPEDYILAMEYDALFGQLVENESAVKGSPPASKSVVENLQVVVLRKEEVGDDGAKVVCAVCKDEVDFGERVTKMPCCHLYHGECIVPWLRIRNTCPVCRFELPTDDAEYEKRKNETGGSRLSDLLVDDLEDEDLYKIKLKTFNFEGRFTTIHKKMKSN